MQPLAGIFCAFWTPTDRSGEVLWSALDRHLSFILDTNIAGIMALGSTGEFIHLTLGQRQQVMERIIKTCKTRGRQVIANVSDASFRNVVALGREAFRAGADCLSVLPPWYFPLEERDVTEFFLQVARQTEAPLALYNYPEVTGKKLSLTTIREVAQGAKVVAIKQSGAEFSYHQELLAVGRELGIPVLTGADTRLADTLALGCTGAISGLANALPEVFQRIYTSFQAGADSSADTGLIAQLAQQIAPLPFPLNVKAAIAARGFDTGEPKQPVSAATQKLYLTVLDELSTWYASLHLKTIA